MNLNLIQLIGRVTKNPELKKLPSGTSIVKFSIATNHTYKKDNGEKVENTSFHSCKAFGKIADTINQYVIKGQELYVEGRLEYETWEKKDGTKVYATAILVNTFQFGAKAKGTEQIEKTPKEKLDEEFPAEDEINPEDIPF